MALLAWAFAIAICIHAILFGGYELGKRSGWWDRDFLPPWLRKVARVLMMEPVLARKKTDAKQPEPQQMPLVFVEVAPAAATPDPPENPTHYSSQNSKAANPEPNLDQQVPKLNGKQTQVPKTEDTPHPAPAPLLPSEKPAPEQAATEKPTPPKPSPRTDQQADAKPKTAPKVGDLAMAKPALNPVDEANATADGSSDAPAPPPPAEVHKRPRTLAEVKRDMIPGQMMKQDGGVKNLSMSASLSAIGSPFGEYDAEIIRAVKLRWDTLIAEQGLVWDHPGQVMLQFRLQPDGRVTDMKVVDATMNDLLTYQCERAVQDPAPYKPWPMELRRLIATDYREVTWVFYYNF